MSSNGSTGRTPAGICPATDWDWHWFMPLSMLTGEALNWTAPPDTAAYSPSVFPQKNRNRNNISGYFQAASRGTITESPPSEVSR